MKRFLPLLLLCGCTVFRSNQHETKEGGRQTRVTIWSFFDSHNDVSKLKTTLTDKSQGIGVGSISENTSASNVVEILRIGADLYKKIP